MYVKFPDCLRTQRFHPEVHANERGKEPSPGKSSQNTDRLAHRKQKRGQAAFRDQRVLYRFSNFTDPHL